MTTARPLAPDVPAEVTPRAAADAAWLQKQLGRRYEGWRETGDELAPFEVALVRRDGRRRWLYGRTLENALARARAVVAGGGRS